MYVITYNDFTVIVEHWINFSFSTGEFPSSLKVAKAIPVFKKGVKLGLNNYRSISLKSNIRKIIEKLIQDSPYFLKKTRYFTTCYLVLEMAILQHLHY